MIPLIKIETFIKDKVFSLLIEKFCNILVKQYSSGFTEFLKVRNHVEL